MAASPSSVRRMAESDDKTTQINSLISNIVPMLHNLNEQGLREVKAYLETQLVDARKSLAKETTKVYPRKNAPAPESPKNGH